MRNEQLWKILELCIVHHDFTPEQVVEYWVERLTQNYPRDMIDVIPLERSHEVAIITVNSAGRKTIHIHYVHDEIGGIEGRYLMSKVKWYNWSDDETQP